MAEETKNPHENSGPASGPPPPAEPVEGPGDLVLDQMAEAKTEFSTDDIDSFLDAQDPEFSQHLKQIGKDTDLSATEAEIDADTAALHDEIERWRTSRGLKRSLYMLMPFLPRLSLMLKKLRFRLFALARAGRIHVQNFGYYLVTEGRRSAQSWLLAQITGAKDAVARSVGDFKKLSLKLKLAFLGLIALFAGGVILIFLTWKGKILPHDQELFITNLADHAGQVYEVDEKEGFENFYDNIRATPNLLLIQKIMVNIRASVNSGRNPMLAAEFFLDGLNPDVIIEVKDREAFFRDLIQRTTEEFDFDTLSGTEGKKAYIEKMLKEINRNLTTGELRSIRIKTIVLKP